MTTARQPVVELVQSAFPPLVAALVSPQAEASCRKNNLSFVEMLQPFCNLPAEAHIRDPSGALLPLRSGLRMSLQYANWEPPAPPLARKWLNEAASLTANPANNITADIGTRQVQMPGCTPWFEAWRSVFLQVQFPSDHEFLKHYLACIIVVSSEDDDPVATVQNLWSACSASGSGPQQLPKWFFSPALHYHVLLHDASSPTADSSRAEQQFGRLKGQFGEAYCTLLPINTQAESPVSQDPPPDPWAQFILSSCPQTAGSPVGGDIPFEEAQEAGEDSMLHPLSPVAPSSPGLPALPRTTVLPPGGRGRLLSAEDREKLRQLVPEFATRVLLPYAEKQILTLTELVIARKGLSRSLFSATKRWFGSGSKPGTAASSPQASPQTPSYAADSAERGLRRLGDLSFLLGLPQLSFPAFHALKRDLAADQAWLMLAGALEMAALSAFLLPDQPPTSPRRAQEYMEEAITTYLTLCRLPQFATRAALLSAEILKSRGLMGEAAQQMIRLTSEDSDLRSALLLEQAAYCFLNTQKMPRLARKYGFHMVLAGHRFNKAGQRVHALRCYLQALQVYEDRQWGLAEDHILFTVGRQSAFLKQLPEARDAFARLLSSGSRQQCSQQAVFLREFLQTLQGLQESGEERVSAMPVPIVDSRNIQTLLGTPPVTPSNSSVVFVSGTAFDKHDNEEISCWERLEEQLVTEAQSQAPLVFKPSSQLLTAYTNNTNKPQAVVNEPVTLQLSLTNPLQLPLTLSKVHLVWNFTAAVEGAITCSNENGPIFGVADALELESVNIDAGATQQVILSVTPKQEGELCITALAIHLSGPSSPDQPNIIVPGKIGLSVRGQRLKGKEESFASDYRLTVSVKGPMPLLQARFEGLCSKLVCGEARRLNVVLKNCGPQPLNNLFLALSPNDAACLALPAGGKPPPSPLTQLGSNQSNQRGYRLGKLETTADAKVVRLPLPAGLLAPGQEITVQLWVKAPMSRGSLKLHFMMYYEGHGSRYRTLRYSWRVSLTNSVSLSAQVLRSACPASQTAENRGESLNLALQVSHAAQQESELSDDEEASLIIQQVALVSKHWHLSPQVIAPQESALRPRESSHLLFKILRSTETCNENVCLYSHTGIGMPASAATWPGLQFLIRELNSVCGDEKLDLNLVLRWRVQKGKEIREGQHQMSLLQLGISTTWPQYGDLPPPPAPALPLEVPAELTAAQSLVCHSLQHTASLLHDFKQARLCVVPVQLLLQNCSDNQLEVTVSTNDVPTGGVVRSTQLYSPHAGAALCFLGPSRRLVTLQPRASASLDLRAALPRPGTYDLARRLSVACKLGNENTMQAWRCASPLIVSQA